MKVHNNIDRLPGFRKAVITIGTFDGVHGGHRQIIRLLQSEAAAIGGETVLITFHPHPRMVIPGGGDAIRVLNTLEEKTRLLASYGIDHLVIVPFNSEFAGQSAEAYIKDFLVARFHPHTIIIGYDHHFGRDRQGNYRLLEAMAEENNYTVKEIPQQVLQDVAISSTRIRQALTDADTDAANALLGYPYFFSGKVIEGNKLGRTIGYPTANLMPGDEYKLIPGNGVYAVEITRTKDEGTLLQGMMNIGVRPTVDGTRRVIEMNIFDFDETIYGETLTVHIRKRLRSEVKFNGLDALKTQLAVDKVSAKMALQKV